MRFHSTNLHPDRKHDDVRLRVHCVLLRRRETMFRRKLYELHHQYGLLMSFGTGRYRIWKLYDARVPDGQRLRRGKTMPASGNDNGGLCFLFGQRTMHVPVGIPVKRFRFLRQTRLP